MRLGTWLTSSFRMLKSAKKPSLEEFWQFLRICLLGIAVIGAIGFLIRFVSAVISLSGG